MSRRMGIGSRAAHPRVCGENKADAILTVLDQGSSPRVRGKLDHNAKDMPHRGLIPACAGKTWPGRRPQTVVWAHPRVCGENRAASNAPRSGGGSSPRVRGKPGGADRDRIVTGLIPACAGKTLAAEAQSGMDRAHPRVCGENPRPAGRMVAKVGSSPRVRGKPVRRMSLRPAERLIPACAGKTMRLLHRQKRTWAHPRVCGENPAPPS